MHVIPNPVQTDAPVVVGAAAGHQQLQQAPHPLAGVGVGAGVGAGVGGNGVQSAMSVDTVVPVDRGFVGEALPSQGGAALGYHQTSIQRKPIKLRIPNIPGQRRTTLVPPPPTQQQQQQQQRPKLVTEDRETEILGGE